MRHQFSLWPWSTLFNEAAVCSHTAHTPPCNNLARVPPTSPRASWGCHPDRTTDTKAPAPTLPYPTYSLIGNLPERVFHSWSGQACKQGFCPLASLHAHLTTNQAARETQHVQYAHTPSHTPPPCGVHTLDRRRSCGTRALSHNLRTKPCRSHAPQSHNPLSPARPPARLRS